MSSPSPPTDEPSVDLKNRWLAGALALLLPGLGHLYQRRNFKAGVYFVCILGLFFTGQALGEWKVVYLGDSETGGRIAGPGNARIVGRLLQGYGAQFPVGVLAWPAIIQSRRYHSEHDNGRARIEEPLTAPFDGGIGINTLNGPRAFARVRGTVTLEPAGGILRGKLVGETDDGQPVEAELARVIELGRKVSANESRTLTAELGSLPKGIDPPQNLRINAESQPYLDGGIPRPFRDRYQVPLGDRGEDKLTAQLGGRLEIAYVFTWIAGLLNVLAIWDAIDGPAYGFGNEPEQKRKSRRRRNDGEESADRARRPEPAARPV